MPFDRFFIGPINAGLQTDVRPFLVPDDAFERLENAYIYYGRVRKRFGSLLMNNEIASNRAQLNSRVRINIGTTDAVTGDFPATVCPGAIFRAGQLFSIGDTIFTVTSNSAGAQPMLSTGAATGTFNVSNGTVTITGNNENPNTTVYYYPSQPIMGIMNYNIAPINDQPTFAFDTQFAYQFVAGGWERLGTAVWTGTNADFFWGANWRGSLSNRVLLFVTNFRAADRMKYWDGGVWTPFNPLYDSTQRIQTARIIIGFKNRLLLLNTVETVAGGDRSFRNRCRYSQNGSPIDANAFRKDIVGRGSFIDAPTKEEIVSAQFIKDRLIVFFERSTWELVYTGNEVLPFRWQQLNSELGVESTFSLVPFDKVVLGVGNVGVHACNGVNVERIDDKIPDQVFEIHNDNDGIVRVSGIRDYFTQLVYWSYPDRNKHHNADPIFPTKVLVYNYINGSWALNDDSITTFGYFQNTSDVRWNTFNQTWQESVEAWQSGAFQGRFRNVLAGNQEGFLFILSPDSSRNAPSLQITNIVVAANQVVLSIVNHNLTTQDYIIIEHAEGVTNLNNNIYRVDRVINDNSIRILQADVTGTYTGGGVASRVSVIDILTKQYNFYAQQGRTAYIQKVNFLVDKTAQGQITVDYFPSSTNLSMINAGQATNALTGTNILETSPFALNPLENIQTRVWHPVYLQTQGETIQLRLYMNDEQVRNRDIAWSDFELNAMLFHARPMASRL